MNARSTYQPPYTITAAIVNLVAEISEAAGRLTVLSDQARALRLRHINHGSLTIEGNTLSESQITEIMDTVTASTPDVAREVTPEVRLLSVLAGEMTRQQLKETLGLKDDEHFRKAYLLPALDAGLIEMTIPDKPRSGKQKYRLTEKGRQLVARSVG
jgi:Fic family protein